MEEVDYPDADLIFEFEHELSENQKQKFSQILNDWAKKGSTEVKPQESVFGGVMHYIGGHDPEYKGRFASFGGDFGSIDIVNALTDLFKTLSEWDEIKIKKVVLGLYEPDLLPSD